MLAQRHLTIKTEQFEGPLDLLLYLIQIHELDISKISISRITGQYLTYIRMMQELNFDLASDFLVMAATLILWKSRAVLPVEEGAAEAESLDDEGLTPEELVRQLLEHKRFLAMGERLSALPHWGEEIFSRANPKPPVSKIWRDMNVTDLALGFQDLLVRARKRKRVLKKETVSLSEKIAEMADRLELNALIDMKKLMSIDPSRGEKVVTFLASLELARLQKMKIYQEIIFGPIFLELLAAIQNLDPSMIETFSPVEGQGASL